MLRIMTQYIAIWNLFLLKKDQNKDVQLNQNKTPYYTLKTDGRTKKAWPEIFQLVSPLQTSLSSHSVCTGTDRMRTGYKLKHLEPTQLLAGVCWRCGFLYPIADCPSVFPERDEDTSVSETGANTFLLRCVQPPRRIHSVSIRKGSIIIVQHTNSGLISSSG